MVFGGKSLGKIDGKNVFVPYAIPGEKLEIEICEQNKDYDNVKKYANIAKTDEKLAQDAVNIKNAAIQATLQTRQDSINYVKVLEQECRKAEFQAAIRRSVSACESKTESVHPVFQISARSDPARFCILSVQTVQPA